MRQIFYFIIIITLSLNCNTLKNNKQNNIVVTYEKKSGKGISPTYTVKIFDNGLIIYHGIKNTDKIGEYKKIISRKKIKDIRNKFLEADFFELKDEYTSKILDLPTTYIEFNYKGKSKRIRDYYGAPQKLKDLEVFLESIINEKDGWEKI